MYQLIIPLKKIQVTSGYKNILRRYSLKTDGLNLVDYISTLPMVSYHFGDSNLNAIRSMPSLLSLVPDQVINTSFLNASAFFRTEVVTINLFFNNLWMIKDNSVNIDAIYAINPDGYNHAICQANIEYCNCEGRYTDTLIDQHEFDEAYILFEQTAKHCPTMFGKAEKDTPPNWSFGGLTDSGINDVDYNDYNRLERALIFLQMARINTLIPAKIALYVGVLECLVSSNSDEDTSKKLKVRIGNLLAGDREEYDAIGSVITTAYNIRSGFVHGNPMRQQFSSKEVMIDNARSIDNLVRQVLRKVATEKAALITDEKKLNVWFGKLDYS